MKHFINEMKQQFIANLSDATDMPMESISDQDIKEAFYFIYLMMSEVRETMTSKPLLCASAKTLQENLFDYDEDKTVDELFKGLALHRALSMGAEVHDGWVAFKVDDKIPIPSMDNTLVTVSTVRITSPSGREYDVSDDDWKGLEHYVESMNPVKYYIPTKGGHDSEQYRKIIDSEWEIKRIHVENGVLELYEKKGREYFPAWKDFDMTLVVEFDDVRPTNISEVAKWLEVPFIQMSNGKIYASN